MTRLEREEARQAARAGQPTCSFCPFGARHVVISDAGKTKKFACGPCSMATPLGTLVRPIEELGQFGGRRQTERKAIRDGAKK